MKETSKDNNINKDGHKYNISTIPNINYTAYK
jgi:hypothetical protein